MTVRRQPTLEEAAEIETKVFCALMLLETIENKNVPQELWDAANQAAEQLSKLADWARAQRDQAVAEIDREERGSEGCVG